MKRSLFAIIVLCLATSGVVLAVDKQKHDFPTIPDAERIRFRLVETETGPMVEVCVGKVVFLAPRLTFLRDGNASSELRAVGHGLTWTSDRGVFRAAQFELSTRLGLPGRSASNRE